MNKIKNSTLKTNLQHLFNSSKNNTVIENCVLESVEKGDLHFPKLVKIRNSIIKGLD